MVLITLNTVIVLRAYKYTTKWYFSSYFFTSLLTDLILGHEAYLALFSVSCLCRDKLTERYVS